MAWHFAALFSALAPSASAAALFCPPLTTMNPMARCIIKRMLFKTFPDVSEAARILFCLSNMQVLSLL
jgi:hypothetical protein